MKKIFQRKYIITFFVVLFIAILSTIVYGAYVNSISVKYSTVSGEMICNFDVDKNDSYVINGIPYVIVTVKNYDENDNITAVAVDYNLTIKNKSGNEGTYIWQKIDNEGSTKYIDGISNYEEQETTNTYSLGNEKKEEEKFKIFIKTSLETYKNLDFNIELNSIQKNIQ